MPVEKYNFCTLFDSGYLSRGLALYYSLEECCDNFHLYIFAFDDNCFKILSSLQLEKATVISLQQFEDEELLKVKPTRNKAEYCWTCAPSTIWYSIQCFELNNCTYIDADLYFYNSPKIIFEEIGDNSVAITKHSFVNKFDDILVGQYCVQFNYFKNDKVGHEALKWWRDSCIDWCYSYYDKDGKYADQKYINEFVTRFPKVHVIQHRGAGVAQWNIYDYLLTENKTLRFKEKKGSNEFSLIFYHYHYTRYEFKDGILTLKAFKVRIPDSIINRLYLPYVEKLVRLNALVINNGNEINIKKRRSKISISLLAFQYVKLKLQRFSVIRFLYSQLILKPGFKTYKGSQDKKSSFD